VRTVVIAVAFLVGACDHDTTATQPTTPPPTPPAVTPDTRPTVVFGDGSAAATVRVEVVDTPPKVERGLMYRQNLPPDDGMLFLLGVEKEWKFWMHNTLVPLDIVFIKRDHTVAGISANAEPLTETLRTVGIPSLYVVEVNAGWCAAHHVTAGTVVHFEGIDSHSALR
jgi:uncharacterized membrane protein (UPF0127 family)